MGPIPQLKGQTQELYDSHHSFVGILREDWYPGKIQPEAALIL